MSFEGAFRKSSQAQLPEAQSYEAVLQQQQSIPLPDSSTISRCLDFSHYGEVWNDREDAMQIARERMLQQKAAELSASMTDKQKDMLDWAEKTFKSKLEDE